MAVDYTQCQSCKKIDPTNVDVRYSFGVYAGRYCVQCAKAKYRDQCGLGDDGRQGTPNEYEELAGPGTYWEEDPSDLL